MFTSALRTSRVRQAQSGEAIPIRAYGVQNHARAMTVKIRFWPSGRFIVAGSRAVSKDAVRPTSSYGAGIAAIRSSPILLSKKLF
jgi:hypothetical protein